MRLDYAKFLMKKTKEDYNEIAEEFAVTRKTMWPELADLDKYVKQGDKVLDVGCGNGRLFRYLMHKNVSYTGLDVSENLIKIARENFKNEPAEFKVFDGLNIECFNKFSCGFDVAYCLATLPHLPGEELRIQFLKSIRKVVKPGSLMIITCWNLWQAKFIRHQIDMTFNFIIDKLTGKGQYDWGDLYIPWHRLDGKIVHRYYHAFTLSELRRILEKAGWRIEELGYKERYNKNKFNLFAVVKKPVISSPLEEGYEEE